MKKGIYNFVISLNVLLSMQSYLKDIMREIGVCNRKGANKSTWELKPEYRHYPPADEEEPQNA